MKIARSCCAAVALALAATGCAGSDADSSQPQAGADSSPASAGSEPPAGADEVPEATQAEASESEGEGNASATFGDQEYRFQTTNCDLDDIDGEDVTGVAMIDGKPAFVEMYALADGTAIIAINVGLSEDTPTDEPLEETLGRGLEMIWNMFVDPRADDTLDVSDTAMSGTGTFQLILTLGEGSSGDTVDGAFDVDCS